MGAQSRRECLTRFCLSGQYDRYGDWHDSGPVRLEHGGWTTGLSEERAHQLLEKLTRATGDK